MSKRKENRKNLKSSLLVLLLIAILLIASTYAWFTANRTVSIDTLEVNVQASNGLQISTNAVDWKAVITNADITGGAYAGNTNRVPTSMEPVSTDGSVTDGNMNMFYGTMAPDEDQGGIYALTAKKETDSSTNRYIVFDIFLKADEAMDLTLTANSNVSAVGTSKGLENAARVALINEGTLPDTTATSTVTAQVGGTAFSVGDRKTVIWEPNAGSHTQEAISNNPYTNLRGSITDGGAPVKYYGIKTEITSPIDRATINDGTDSTHFAEMIGAGLTTTNKGTDDGITPVENFFHIDEGITKVRVYMWVEGQDVDCDNSASGTDIAFNIELNAPENEKP